MGISDAQKAKMFTQFSKAKQENVSVNKEGVGMGLYISKELITQFGGYITFESVLGCWTKFMVTLPLNTTFLNLKDVNL